jgi:uncharacterized membrane protein YfcA
MRWRGRDSCQHSALSIQLSPLLAKAARNGAPGGEKQTLNRKGRRGIAESAEKDKVMPDAAAQSDAWIYVLGAFLGMCAGVLDVGAGDLLLTALLVLASTMVLGGLRPERPWRWTATVAVFVPLVQLAAYLFMAEKPYRAHIYESFLGFLTGIAGAYGGAVVRRGVEELFK